MGDLYRTWVWNIEDRGERQNKDDTGRTWGRQAEHRV